MCRWVESWKCHSNIASGRTVDELHYHSNIYFVFSWLLCTWFRIRKFNKISFQLTITISAWHASELVHLTIYLFPYIDQVPQLPFWVTPISLLPERHLDPGGSSSSPLQWPMKTPIRLNNKCWVLCFLARLSLSCKIPGRILHGWLSSKQHSFRLHGVTCCQIIWFFRNQSGRSSKSMIAFVRRCHYHSQRWSLIQVSCRSSSSGL